MQLHESINGVLPTQKIRMKSKARETQNPACNEGTTASMDYPEQKIRKLRSIPRLDLNQKKELTNVEAPAYEDRIVEATGTQGHPLFWNELKSVDLWQKIFTDLNLTHVWDLTPGSGAAAIAACYLGISYEGIGMNDKHCQWLDNIMDSAIFAIIDMRRGTEEIGGITDKEFIEPVRNYFQTLVDEGRRYVKQAESDDESDEDADEEGEDDEENNEVDA
jgi:hypothetical protein